MQPRIYTYKITFEEVPYYYYGSKKEQYFNEEYLGSPKTNKWCWELYTPRKQILEIFEYSDDGYNECRKVEDRLIKPVLNDPWCLNESCGGNHSLKVLRESGRKGGKKAVELSLGIHNFETRSKAGKIGGSISAKVHKEKCLGLYSLTDEEREKYGKIGGMIRKEQGMPEGVKITPETAKIYGKRGGKSTMEKRRKDGTLYDLVSNAGKIGGKVTSSQRWRCLVTGHISNAASLARYQKARGIDTTQRERVE